MTQPDNMQTAITITKGDDGRRLMMLVSSNGYIDREGEHVMEKALAEYVERCWDGDEYVGTNVLLCWHSDTFRTSSKNAIGDIVYANMIAGFLVEVARERENVEVDISRKKPDGTTDKPYTVTVKELWDAIEKSPDLWGASIGFAYMQDPDAPDDGTYDHIFKYETSVLLHEAAANPFTLSKVIKEETHV